jgi:putative ABC transport system substrate-binding protein
MSKSKLVAIALIVVAAIATWLMAPAPSDQPQKLIAVMTLVSHPALDSIQEGIKSELAAQGFVEGKNAKYLVRNASGQIQLAATIAAEIAALKPDVAIAITTPMAQAAGKAIKSPLVFSAVTDPVGAGLVKSMDKGEGELTGVSDAWPYEEQLKLIRRIGPGIKKLGVIYNPGEAPSQYGIKEIRRYASGLGFEIEEGAVNSTIEVFPVAKSLAARVDALFLSSDSTAIGGVAAAMRVAADRKIGLFVGDSGTVAKGGLAAVSVGYTELGHETGRLAARLLRGERSIAPVVAKGVDVYLNKKAAELMGITLPEDVVRSATKVYETIAP